MKRTLKRIGIIGMSASLLFVLVSWGYAHRLTGPRQRPVGAPPGDFPFPIETAVLASSDGETLSAWYAPAPTNDKAIVLLHGYGGNRKSMLPRARHFRQAGYSVLLYDARACGESSGDRVTFGYRERHDLVAAVAFLKERHHEKIACLGVSQGGATITFAGAELPEMTCAICESAYDEMSHAVDRRLRRYTGMPGWFAGSLLVPFAEHRLGLTVDEVKPSVHIASLPCPVFIISGDRDDRTMPDDTRRLFEAAREPKEMWMIEGARHEDLFRFPGYQEKVAAFLDRHLR